MNESDAKKAERTRIHYPPGTRLVLDHMEDTIHPVPAGTWGTVQMVDDGNNIHMLWDNGRALALVPEADTFHKVTAQDMERRNVIVRDAVKDYMAFEEETSSSYPFASTYEELPEETVQAILAECEGHTDTETIHAAIRTVVGTSPEPCKEQKVSESEETGEMQFI